MKHVIHNQSADYIKMQLRAHNKTARFDRPFAYTRVLCDCRPAKLVFIRTGSCLPTSCLALLHNSQKTLLLIAWKDSHLHQKRFHQIKVVRKKNHHAVC